MVGKDWSTVVEGNEGGRGWEEGRGRMGESGRGQWGKVVEEKTLARLSALLKICKKCFCHTDKSQILFSYN